MKIGKIEIKQKDGKFLGVFLGKEKIDEIIFADVAAMYSENKCYGQLRIHVDPSKMNNWREEKSELQKVCEAEGFEFKVKTHSPRLRFPKRPKTIETGTNVNDKNRRTRARRNSPKVSS